MDSIDLTHFIMHGANEVPAGFKLIKRIPINWKGNASNPTREKLTLTDFQLIKVIGKGAFGKVVLARRKVWPTENKSTL